MLDQLNVFFLLLLQLSFYAFIQAAFRGNTVGLPKFPQIRSLRLINRDVLQTFLRSYFTPARMTVAGVGVDHEQLCNLSEKYISGMNSVF